MTEEFLDIVNENNELTGESAPRSKIHAEGLWHRTVHVYLFRKGENSLEFLVHLRSKLKDSNPNMWDTRFGGHIKAGSTVEEGVDAELEEEIGLKVDGERLIEGVWKKSDKFPNCQFSKNYFLEYTGKIEDLSFNDGEVQKVQWMSIDEIKKSKMENPGNWSGSLEGFINTSNYLLERI